MYRWCADPAWASWWLGDELGAAIHLTTLRAQAAAGTARYYAALAAAAEADIVAAARAAALAGPPSGGTPRWSSASGSTSPSSRPRTCRRYRSITRAGHPATVPCSRRPARRPAAGYTRDDLGCAKADPLKV